MSEGGKRLREVTDNEELSNLKSRMTQYLPHSQFICGILDIKDRYNLSGDTSTSIYIPDGPQPSSLVVATPGCSSVRFKSMTLFWSAEEEDDEKVAILLATLPSCEWKRPLLLYGCPIYVLRKLDSIINHKCLANGQVSLHPTCEGIMFTIKQEDIPEYQLPEGYTLDCLKEEHIDYISSFWKYNYMESASGLSSLLLHLPSSAVFRQTEGGGRELVSWIFTYKTNAIGNTFTVPEYRKLGLARAVTLDLAQKVIKVGLTAFLAVDETNDLSLAFHEKIGFRRQCGIGWNLSLPLGQTLEDALGQ